MADAELDLILASVRRRFGSGFAPAGDEGVVGGFSSQIVVFEEPGGRRVLVRLPPAEGPYPPYEVVREGQLLKRLAGAVGVPGVLAISESPAPGQREFIVLEWLDGAIKLPGPDSEIGDSEAAARDRAAAVMGSLASIHEVDWRGLGLRDVLEGAGSESLAERYLAKWEAVLTELSVAAPAIAWYGLGRLRESVPAEEEIVLVHGDFRLGNLLWGEDRVSILDWEHATLGDPLFDLAWALMGAVAEGDQVMGLVTKAEAIGLYEERRSAPVDRDRLRWWEAMAVWTRLCMEARSFEFEAEQSLPDLRCILWQFGSLRSADELLRLIARDSKGRQVVR